MGGTVALGNVSAIAATSGAFRVAATTNPRGDRDSWGGWSHEQQLATPSAYAIDALELATGPTRAQEMPESSSDAAAAVTLEGLTNAVNLELASRAGVLIAPIFSAWSDLVRLLISSPLSAASGPMCYCCSCSRKERTGKIGNVWVVLAASMPADVQARVRATFENTTTQGCVRVQRP